VEGATRSGSYKGVYGGASRMLTIHQTGNAGAASFAGLAKGRPGKSGFLRNALQLFLPEPVVALLQMDALHQLPHRPLRDARSRAKCRLDVEATRTVFEGLHAGDEPPPCQAELEGVAFLIRRHGLVGRIAGRHLCEGPTRRAAKTETTVDGRQLRLGFHFHVYHLGEQLRLGPEDIRTPDRARDEAHCETAPILAHPPGIGP